ncbi:hypothetical protein K469DRAFT_590376 [Zopfia rhizophila CBS 207.26]|uniref:Ubiquitin 3 binding protein But2 C-terminal domain-containing protein n=1 Tax=Zopfia rhizophila CBS 207.26 TaxID=1314779 RepID=A0A6A6DNI1_9PEZI|nr:hypothetical protein K469DRAFT_590376 [Zopfia rhizophila CBS 207.26]
MFLIARSTLLLAAIAPALVTAAPPEHVPKVTSLQFSGSGCPSSSGSVHSSEALLGDTQSFTFGQLGSDSTENCEIHLQGSGASSGWQVAIKEVTYKGDVRLKPGTQLDYFTQIFWSDRAADTTTLSGHITCTGPDFKEPVTLLQTVPASNPAWSKCIGDDGNTGILNVNFRPVISGNEGHFDFKSATWNLQWRKC